MATQKFIYESDLDVLGESGTSLYGFVRANSLSTGLTINAVSNDAATESVNTQVPFRASSTRKYGIICRHIVLMRTTTTAPLNVIELRKIVVFQRSIFIEYISQVGGSIAYNGLEDWKLIGAMNERFRLFFNGS